MRPFIRLKKQQKNHSLRIVVFCFWSDGRGLAKSQIVWLQLAFYKQFFQLFFIFVFIFCNFNDIDVSFFKVKKTVIFRFVIVVCKGFCFCCTLKHVFLTFTFLKAVVIFLIFLVEECLFLFQICQILIYYCRHNISKCSIFNEFNCFLLICCVVFAFLITLLNFVFLRLLLGCA